MGSMGTLRCGALKWSALVTTLCVTACAGDAGDSTTGPTGPAAGARSPAPGLTSQASPTGQAAAAASTPATQPAVSNSGAASNSGAINRAAPNGSASPDAAATAAAAGAAPAAGGGTPCAVSEALAAACQKCHDASPKFGAPMPLVTPADFQKPSPSDPSMPVYKLAMARLNDTARPMPPASAITPADKQTLSDWLAQGAVAAPATQGACAPPSGVTSSGEPNARAAVHDDAYFKNGLAPKEGETCYEFATHGAQMEGDSSKFTVRAGEFYEQFYYRVPWKQDEVMVRFGAKYDNLKVLHHWLLFTSSMSEAKIGTHETTSGSTLGDTSQLIAGWAVGGDQTEFPNDTALELTPSGILNIQWHYFNQGNQPEPDATHVQVCTVPRSMRKNIGSITFLGTEDFNGPLGMPAKTKSDFGGTCLNDSGGPITIFGFTPHMHKLGINMRAVIMRKSGMMEEVFNKPFDFNSQIGYVLPTPVVLEAGESIVSTCTFDNTTNAGVPFGPSSNQEMCYNYAMSFPARALDNGVVSLIGATNTCW